MPIYTFEFNFCANTCENFDIDIDTPPLCIETPPIKDFLSIILNKGIVQIKIIPSASTKKILELHFPGTGQYQIQKINPSNQKIAIFSTKIPDSNLYFIGDAIVSLYEDISEMCDFTISKGYLDQESTPNFIEISINSIEDSAAGNYIYIYYTSNKTKERYIIPINNNIDELIGKKIQIYGETEEHVGIDVMCIKEYKEKTQICTNPEQEQNDVTYTNKLKYINKIKNLEEALKNIYLKNKSIPENIENLTQTQDINMSLNILNKKLQSDKNLLNILSGKYEKIYESNLTYSQDNTKLLLNNSHNYLRIDEFSTNNTDQYIFYDLLVKFTINNLNIEDLKSFSLSLLIDNASISLNGSFDNQNNTLSLTYKSQGKEINSVVSIIKELIDFIPVLFVNNNRSFIYFLGNKPKFSYNSSISGNVATVNLSENNQILHIFLALSLNTNKNIIASLSTNLLKGSSTDIASNASIEIYKIQKIFSKKVVVPINIPSF